MRVNLDLLITLRCNQSCLNCIKLCNMYKETGLDYSHSDMTLEQIDKFCDQVRSSKLKIDRITITGGEPLIHPELEPIVKKIRTLDTDKVIKSLRINTNLSLPIPEYCKNYIINYTKLKNKSKRHNVVLLHPSDFGMTSKSYYSCKHYRKSTIVLSYQGYSICCAGDAYIRLFCMDHLILPSFPDSIKDFPLNEMSDICVHCPFSNDSLPYERVLGHPISTIYKHEAEQNKKGRRIEKIF